MEFISLFSPCQIPFNMSAYPFAEVNLVAASVLDQLAPKLTLLFALIKGPRTRGFRRGFFLQAFAIMLTIYKPSEVLWQSDLALILNTSAGFVAIKKKNV